MNTMTAQTLVFDIRPQGTDINYGGACTPDSPIEKGWNITLCKGNVKICVNVTNVNSQNEIEGVVTSFKNFDGNEFEGLCVNSPITFSSDYVYTCSC